VCDAVVPVPSSSPASVLEQFPATTELSKLQLQSQISNRKKSEIVFPLIAAFFEGLKVQTSAQILLVKDKAVKANYWQVRQIATFFSNFSTTLCSFVRLHYRFKIENLGIYTCRSLGIVYSRKRKHLEN
jgi:hypothetical protein